MFRGLIAWMDRDWARQDYNVTFRSWQRVLLVLPVLVSLILADMLEVFGLPSNGAVGLTIFAFGVVTSLVVTAVSLYRWAMGYGRSDYQERKAAELKAALAARRAGSNGVNRNPKGKKDR